MGYWRSLRAGFPRQLWAGKSTISRGLAYPLFWLLGLVLARLPAEQARDYALLFHLLIIMGVLVAALIAGRLVRKPAVAA